MGNAAYKALGILFCIAVLFPLSAFTQGGQWVWVKGPNTTNNPPTYGTMGVASATNNPPALYEAANWMDRDGNFWIFGGLDHSQEENTDLWRYSPLDNEWTWVKGQGVPLQAGIYGTMGISASSNQPGARAWGASSWTDNEGHLWLFGGSGYDIDGQSGLLSDLWMYDINSNQWTWVNGSSHVGASMVYGQKGIAAVTNTPGGSAETTSNWVDANDNLWLFGGQKYVGGYVTNVIWKYNIANNLWTWINGSQQMNNLGSYGIMGVPDSINQPPARGSYINWKDLQGNFYIFGGSDFVDKNRSDVWKYDPVNNLWTWVAGDSTTDSNGDYVGYCNNNGNTGPRSRFENRGAQTQGCGANVFLTFGGANDTANGPAWRNMNDLWLFNTDDYQWKWIGGPDSLLNPGSYGNMGITSTANLPPSRIGPCMWSDHHGVLWLFGGTATIQSSYSDLWKFIPDISCTQFSLWSGINAQLQQRQICRGDSALISISGTSNVQIQPTASVYFIDSTHAWLKPDSSITYIVSGASSCRNTDTAYVKLKVVQPGALNYMIDTPLCLGSSALLTFPDQQFVTIWPSTNVVRWDSINFLLQPDTTTTYAVKGISSVCGENDSAVVTLPIQYYNPVSIVWEDTVTCAGHLLNVNITGLTNIKFKTTPGYVNTDSTHLAFVINQVGTLPCVIAGTTSCGSVITDSVNLRWKSTGVLLYKLSRVGICLGDTSILTLPFHQNARITPENSATWLDSAHVLLHPDTNTVYHVYALSNCGGYDSAAIAIRVVLPGSVNYTVTAPGICLGMMDTINVFGLTNVAINPSFYSITNIDSTDIFFSVSPSVSSDYIISGQSICGGLDTANVGIAVQSNPTYTAWNPDLCFGDSLIMTLTELNNIFISPDTDVLKLDSIHYLFFPTQNTSYNITATNYCVGYFLLETGITVDRPVSTTWVSETTICEGDSAILCAAEPEPFVSYLWSNSDTTICTNAWQTGTYNLTATDANGCSSVSAPIFITMDSVTPLAVSCHGDTLFANESANLQWYLDGNKIVGATGSFYVASASGSYVVTSLTKNCGFISSSPYQYTPMSLNELLPEEVNVFPNPSADSWILMVSDNQIGGKLEIFDAKGQIVYRAEISGRLSELSPVLANGVYLLCVYSTDRVIAKKLVKI